MEVGGEGIFCAYSGLDDVGNPRICVPWHWEGTKTPEWRNWPTLSREADPGLARILTSPAFNLDFLTLRSPRLEGYVGLWFEKEKP